MVAGRGAARAWRRARSPSRNGTVTADMSRAVAASRHPSPLVGRPRPRRRRRRATLGAGGANYQAAIAEPDATGSPPGGAMPAGAQILRWTSRAGEVTSSSPRPGPRLEGLARLADGCLPVFSFGFFFSFSTAAGWAAWERESISRVKPTSNTGGGKLRGWAVVGALHAEVR
jgi:hypothetical protein